MWIPRCFISCKIITVGTATSISYLMIYCTVLSLLLIEVFNFKTPAPQTEFWFMPDWSRSVFQVLRKTWNKGLT